VKERERESERKKEQEGEFLCGRTNVPYSKQATRSYFPKLNCRLDRKPKKKKKKEPSVTGSMQQTEEEDQTTKPSTKGGRGRHVRKLSPYEQKLDFRPTEKKKIQLKRTNRTKKLLWTPELHELFVNVLKKLGDTGNNYN